VGSRHKPGDDATGRGLATDLIEGGIRVRKLMLLGATAAVMLSTMSTTAMAEWIEHPYENVGQWRCDYYYDGGIYDRYTYWCNAPDMSTGEWTWFRALPGWQDRT
jgi:hypothetical protein